VFAVEIWGTVADWTVSLLTVLSAATAVIYYIFDRQRARRAQAGSVLVWLHPYEHGPPMIKMQNLSDKPVFDHGFLIASKAQRAIEKLARKGWGPFGPQGWPNNNKFSLQQRYSGLEYHDGSELYLSPGAQFEHQPQLAFSSAVYDYYGYFRDVAGEYWLIDARTQRPATWWKSRRFRIGPSGLDAT
jgi:hypothetical protein